MHIYQGISPMPKSHIKQTPKILDQWDSNTARANASTRQIGQLPRVHGHLWAQPQPCCIIRGMIQQGPRTLVKRHIHWPWGDTVQAINICLSCQCPPPECSNITHMSMILCRTMSFKITKYTFIASSYHFIHFYAFTTANKIKIIIREVWPNLLLSYFFSMSHGKLRVARRLKQNANFVKIKRLHTLQINLYSFCTEPAFTFFLLLFLSHVCSCCFCDACLLALNSKECVSRV